MVAEGEDWKSVEVPATSGSTVPASSTAEETEESKQPTGGNSNVIDLYIYVYPNKF